MSYQCHSPLSYKGHGDWDRFLKTGRQQMSVLSSRKARRKVTTGWSPLPQSLGR